MKMISTLFAAIFIVNAPIAIGHGGGLDKNGGHSDRRSGSYHCHKDPCLSAHGSTKKATLEAVQAGRPLSYLYKRDDWKHWSDFDGDCMNTRHEILQQQAVGSVRLSPDHCYVSSGVWNDPYSGKTFTRASDLDIDHIVPLKWASDHGGALWSPNKKERFANDPVNLLAVDDALNQAKGARGPSEWMPPNHKFRCEYLGMWQSVLKAYPTLKMSSSEHRIFTKQLGSCEK
jgi:hypothetical protein